MMSLKEALELVIQLADSNDRMDARDAKEFAKATPILRAAAAFCEAYRERTQSQTFDESWGASFAAWRALLDAEAGKAHG